MRFFGGRMLVGVSLTVAVGMGGVLAGGCSYKSISHGTEITEEQMNSIVDGRSTKKDIILMFGDPAKTMDNEKIFFYTWTRGSKSSFIGLGGGEAYTHSLTIFFDDSGMVTQHRLTRGSTTGGAQAAD